MSNSSSSERSSTSTTSGPKTVTTTTTGDTDTISESGFTPQKWLEIEEAMEHKWHVTTPSPAIFFHAQVTANMKYTQQFFDKMKILVDRLAGLFVTSLPSDSEDVPDFDEIQVKSRFESFANKLVLVEFEEESDKAKVEKIKKTALKVAALERKVFDKTRAENMSIYDLVTDNRLDMQNRCLKLNQKLDSCNIRRRMVSDAEILMDLAVKISYYVNGLTALEDQVADTLSLSRAYEINVPAYLEHLKMILSVYLTEVCSLRNEAFSGAENKNIVLNPYLYPILELAEDQRPNPGVFVKKLKKEPPKSIYQ